MSAGPAREAPAHDLPALSRCLVCGAHEAPVSLLRDGRLWASCGPCSRTPLVEEQLRGATRVSQAGLAALAAATRAPVSMLDATSAPLLLAGDADAADLAAGRALGAASLERSQAALQARAASHPGGLGGGRADDAATPDALPHATVAALLRPDD